MTESDGYNDDRMFVLHVARCTIRELSESTIETTIHHEAAPEGHLWCLVTYRNTPRYPATRVDHFSTEAAAEDYRRRVEPEVPLLSLGGKPPATPLPYEEFVAWKSGNGFTDYNYRLMYSAGSNPREIVTGAAPEWLLAARRRDEDFVQSLMKRRGLSQEGAIAELEKWGF